MVQKYRAQILLEPEQHQALQKIAERDGRSISQVAREVIRLGLSAMEQEAEKRWAQRMQALEQLQRLRDEIREQHGVYQGNLVDEVRSERENQLDRTRKKG